MRKTVFASKAIVIMLLAWIGTGCETSPTPQPTDAVPGTDAPLMDHAEHQDPAVDPGDEVQAALAGLSPEDRQSAEQQRICPVSDQPLGSMGEPIKLEVEGREVWICCAGCEGSLQNDPEQYLAKLNDG